MRNITVKTLISITVALFVPLTTSLTVLAEGPVFPDPGFESGTISVPEMERAVAVVTADGQVAPYNGRFMLKVDGRGDYALVVIHIQPKPGERVEFYINTIFTEGRNSHVRVLVCSVEPTQGFTIRQQMIFWPGQISGWVAIFVDIPTDYHDPSIGFVALDAILYADTPMEAGHGLTYWPIQVSDGHGNALNGATIWEGWLDEAGRFVPIASNPQFTTADAQGRDGMALLAGNGGSRAVKVQYAQEGVLHEAISGPLESGKINKIFVDLR